MGFSIAIGYLLIRCSFDGFFLVTWGFPHGSSPLWRNDIWWPELVNAALLGYVPAVLVIAHRGIDRDLSQLRPWLPRTDAEVDDIRAAATGRAGFVGQTYKLIGVVGAVVLVVVDPSFTQGAEPSLTNPAFMWPLLRTSLFAWFVSSLIVADLQATRTYLHMGQT